MTDTEMTPGEIQRCLERIDKNIDALRGEVRERHHQLSGEVTAVVVPVSTLTLRVTSAEDAIKALQRDMRSTMLRAAALSGAIAVAAFIVKLLLGR